MKELKDLVMLLRYAISDIEAYSVYHDDVLNDEVLELLQTVRKIQVKIDKETI